MELEAAAETLGNETSLGIVPDVASAIAMMRSDTPDVLLVQLSGSDQPLSAWKQAIDVYEVSCPIVGILDDDDDPAEGLLVEAVRIGFRDFLRRPASAGELAGVISRVGKSRPETSRRGRLLAVASTKGGVGKSTLAINTAVHWARTRDQSVLLVDASLQLGVAASLLNLTPDLTIADVAAMQDRLDATLLRDVTTRHESGLHVMAAPPTPADAAEIDDATMSVILGIAKSAFDLVIVDSFPLLDATTLAILDRSDHVCIVTENVIPTLTGTAAMLKTLDQLEIGRAQRTLVLNRFQRCAGSLSATDVAEQLGETVQSVLPYDRRVLEAANLGRPIVTSRSWWGTGKAIQKLADTLLTRVSAGDETIRSVTLKSSASDKRRRRDGRTPHEFATGRVHDRVEWGTAMSDEANLRARLGKVGRPTSLTPRSPQPERLSDTPASESGEVNRRRRAVTVKGRLHGQLLDDLDRRGLLSADVEQLKGEVDSFVADVAASEQLPLNESERARLSDDLLEETLGLGPLAPLMADPSVTDILVNGPHHVFVERYGKLELTDIEFRDDDHLTRIISRIATRVGRRVDESQPMVDARLPDGSRVNATLPPVTLDGPTLSIRRFGRKRLRADELQRLGMFSETMAAFFAVAVRARLNVLISGGTGSGKSTFLGAICESIPDDERVVTIEDAAELVLDQLHVVRMETRPANVEGRGVISARDLVVNALRMRPDRIIVGEVRSGESLDMLQAMNTGHDGSLTTAHANSPRDAISRLSTMVLMSGMELPAVAIREQIVSAIDLIIHVRRFEDGVRRVESVEELVGLEGNTPQLQQIYRFEVQGRKGKRLQGRHVATGTVPRLVEKLNARAIDIPTTWFEKPSG